MLVRITNRCNSNCSHCGIDASGPEGQHMDYNTWCKFIEFNNSNDLLYLISGGEPFLHPNFPEWILQAILANSITMPIIIATNGIPLKQKEYTDAILQLIQNDITIQITNDSKYYTNQFTPEDYIELTHKIPIKYLKKIVYSNKVHSIFPCDRTKKNNIQSSRFSPSCFNLRSAVKRIGFFDGLLLLRHPKRSFVCTPSINVDGTIVAGEFDSCQKIGNIFDTSISEIEKNLFKKCNKCGLMNNLTEQQLKAIK